MPSQKKLDKYPDLYRALFLLAHTKGLVVVDPAPYGVSAAILRRDLYNFRQALREETPRPPTELDSALLDAADKLQFKIRENKVIVCRYTHAYIPIIAQALREFNHGS